MNRKNVYNKPDYRLSWCCLMRAFIRVIALVLCIAVVSSVCVFAQEPELTLITPPTRVDFYEGRDWGFVRGEIFPYANFDMSGAVLEYDGEEIPYYVFPWGANMWCEPASGTWTTGQNDVDIFIDDVDGVSTRSSINLHSITSIKIAESPSYTHYIRGVDWDYNSDGEIAVNAIKLDGLKLKVTYSDGTSDVVAYDKKTETIAWTVTNDTYKFVLGKNELYATYNGKKAKFCFDIELESITKAYVSQQPEKLSYAFGTDWRYVRKKVVPKIDLTGLVVAANYNNGETKYISYAEEPERFSIKENQSFQAGQNTARLLLDSEFELYFEFTTQMYGDVNLDALVNSTDALCVLKHIVGAIPLEELSQKYADVNDDGKITSADALAILGKSAELIEFFESEI